MHILRTILEIQKLTYLRMSYKLKKEFGELFNINDMTIFVGWVGYIEAVTVKTHNTTLNFIKLLHVPPKI